MAEIILVRHGQASFGAANYDKLSELGVQQAQWLGQYWRQLGQPIDQVFLGSMVRHQETAEGILQAYADQSVASSVCPGFNEYSFRALLDAMRERHPQQWVDSGHAKRDYFYNMRAALGLWMAGEIESDGEQTWLQFRDAILSAWQQVVDSGAKCAVVVTSGGPIGVLMSELLGLDTETTCNTTLQVKNTSCTRFLVGRQGRTLDAFNEIAHLRQFGSEDAITFS